MGPSHSCDRVNVTQLARKLGIVLLPVIMAITLTAQDIKLNLTYVCNGERIYVESCNIRELSDTSTCMVAHPDRPQHNGFMAYTYETRGTLKNLFPTCKQPTALAGGPYVLLRDSYTNALARGGVAVPPGMSPYKYVGTACAARTPDCQKIMDAIKANAASAVRADANGSGTFPGVAPGNYYLMISARYNNQSLVWEQAVQLRPGSNSLTLDERNATPIN